MCGPSMQPWSQGKNKARGTECKRRKNERGLEKVIIWWPDPGIHRDSQQGAISGHQAFLQSASPINMITGECRGGSQQVRSSFWFREWSNPSDRTLDTISVCSLANHDFCWQFHEDSFLHHSQRCCQHTISSLQGISLSLWQLDLSVGDEKWPMPLTLSYMRWVLKMEIIRCYLSFKDRIRVFIEEMEIIVFTWLVWGTFLIYQCINVSQSLI